MVRAKQIGRPGLQLKGHLRERLSHGRRQGKAGAKALFDIVGGDGRGVHPVGGSKMMASKAWGMFGGAIEIERWATFANYSRVELVRALLGRD